MHLIERKAKKKEFMQSGWQSEIDYIRKWQRREIERKRKQEGQRKGCKRTVKRMNEKKKNLKKNEMTD